MALQPAGGRTGPPGAHRQYDVQAGEDRRFGYVSASSRVTVPLGGRTALGAWRVHGGVEYQALGTTAKAFNNGDASAVIGSIGVGWTR